LTRADKKVRRKSVEDLPPSFGSDKGKALVITISAGAGETLVSLRPLRSSRELAITAVDLYFYLIKCKANVERVFKARDAKAKKAITRERKAIERAEKALTRKPRKKS
jgi:hypothetical protein